MYAFSYNFYGTQMSDRRTRVTYRIAEPLLRLTIIVPTPVRGADVRFRHAAVVSVRIEITGGRTAHPAIIEADVQ